MRETDRLTDRHTHRHTHTHTHTHTQTDGTKHSIVAHFVGATIIR